MGRDVGASGMELYPAAECGRWLLGWCTAGYGLQSRARAEESHHAPRDT